MTEPNYFEELAAAPVWDGHTPYEAIERIRKIGKANYKCI